MPQAEPIATRLCLVTPAAADPARLPALAGSAFTGGDVASLIIAAEDAGPADLQRLAEAVVPIAIGSGVATVIAGDPAIAARVGADGAYVESGMAGLKDAFARFRPGGIVGAGGIRSRHDAMTFGEALPDYLFFGRLDGDGEPRIHHRSLELAAWWAALFEIPAIVMGGSAVASVAEAAEAGIEFVALRRAVWDHPGGPGVAVAEANQLLGGTVRKFT